MKKIIVANWKLNPSSQKEAEQLFDAVKEGVKDLESAKVIICPPYVYLSLLKGLTLGSQNVSYQEKGAFTGQVSALMLKDLGVEYVIIGHSEARQYLAEKNEDINKKIKECLEEGLKIIFCIGEQDGEDKETVLKQQIEEGLDGVSDVENIIVAYEPVWAIGTGKNCSIEETKSSVALIKKLLGQISIKILYGGSVNAENASGYLNEADVDGLLVGGASLKAEEFIKIVASA